jgi:hypothetical protein
MIKQVRIILIIITLGASLSSYSQAYIGGRLGLNMSTLSIQPELIQYNKVSDFVPILNVNIALFGYFEIGPYFAIQPEFVYNRKGLKSNIDARVGENNDTLLTGEWDYSMDYIEVPLMFKLSLNSEGFDPFIEFGGYYGYMVYAQYQAQAYLADDQILDEDYRLGFEDTDGKSFERNEWGFKVGIGGTLKLSKGAAFFSIRYSQGLTDIIKYDIQPEDYRETYNRVFMLTLGYAFELRRNTAEKVFYY